MIDSKLSAPSFMIANVMANPWERLRTEWPEVEVTYEDLGTRWAVTRWMRSGRVSIALNHRLNQAERRVSIAHECAHLRSGRPHGTLRESEEQRVRVTTACWLLPDIEQLGRTLAVYDLRQAASELWVTFPVLVDRLNALSDDESRYVHSFREDIA
jgi:hypothetical protein